MISKHLEVVKKLRLRPRFSTHFSGFGYPDETLFLVFDLLREAQSQPAVMVNYAISFRFGESHSLAMAVSIIFKIKVLNKQIKITL